MALATATLDTTATLTGDEIITRVNAGSTPITRASSVNGGALVAETVGSAAITNGSIVATDLSSTAARDNLNAMSDIDRHYVKTRPTTGKHKVFAFQRRSDGLVEVEYDDTAEA